MFIFDVETDGLDPTLIHCIGYSQSGSKDVTTLTQYDDMRKFFLSSEALIAHNAVMYDVPAIEKILGIKVKARIIDTLALSWTIFPNRPRHGLEGWGEEFGIPKPVVDDWEGQPIEVYLDRVTEDVKINSMLWDELMGVLSLLYDSSDGIDKYCDYLSFKMHCAQLQSEARWKLDIPKCTKGLEELSKDKEVRVALLAKAMPYVPIIAKKTRPKKPYKQDGSPSATGIRWQEVLKGAGKPSTYQGIVPVVTGYKEPNPNSHQQVKRWLYSLGWVPDEYKHVRNKETNEFKKIEQINKREPGAVGVCASVALLYGVEPAVEHLDGLYVISHRISILEGFLSNVSEDGYVKAEIGGLTNTLRFTHRVCVNLPGVDKPYGKLIRGCLTAPKGYELCGSDMCGIEDRTGQHYMWPHDPEYVKDQMDSVFDPHLDMAKTAGLMNDKQIGEYRQGKMHNAIRHQAKQVNYSAKYGISYKSLSRNSGMSLSSAKTLVEAYWKRNWSLKAIAAEQVVKVVSGQTWLYNPVSGFWYSLRHTKDIFSTLNQGTATYCFDVWVKHVLKSRPQLTGQFHDEVILCIKVGYRDRCEGMLRRAIASTNKELKLNRELDIDVEFGGSYADIH